MAKNFIIGLLILFSCPQLYGYDPSNKVNGPDNII